MLNTRERLNSFLAFAVEKQKNGDSLRVAALYTVRSDTQPFGSPTTDSRKPTCWRGKRKHPHRHDCPCLTRPPPPGKGPRL